MGELRDRMVRDMEVRNFSLRTIEAYVGWVRNLTKYYMRRPDQLSDQEIHAYLLHLRDGRKRAASTCNQACAALRFFFEITVQRPRTALSVPLMRGEQKLPEILSRQEVERIITATTTLRQRLMLMACYGGGLRVSELVTLRPGAIDAERGVIHVVQGKGRKDRYTVLSERLQRELAQYYAVYGTPQNWVFCSSRDPKRHIDVSVAQRVYNAAKRRAGVQKSGGIHALRHAFATHTLEAGLDLPTLGRVLGHTSIKTTMRYLHTTTERVSAQISPLDRLVLSKPSGVS